MNNPGPVSRLRILLADDDAQFQRSLADALDRFGFDCHCAGSALEAQEQLHRSQFDAFITEIQMPGNKELELVEYLSNLKRGLPVILLTREPTVETATRAVCLPVTAYLTKPPDLNELRVILNRAVISQGSNRIVHAHRQRLQQWDDELEAIEQRLRKPVIDGADDASVSFVRLTLRNMILTLADLEKSVAVVQTHAASSGLQHTEIVSAVRRTVTVLEKTKQNFKSKELGALRQDLERFLVVR